MERAQSLEGLLGDTANDVQPEPLTGQSHCPWCLWQNNPDTLVLVAGAPPRTSKKKKRVRGKKHLAADQDLDTKGQCLKQGLAFFPGFEGPRHHVSAAKSADPR